MVQSSSLVGQDAKPQPEAVLVSGASFAGLATAWWMLRLGYRVTVIEVAPGLRKGGTPVDIEGETIDVLARMGLIDAVMAKALPPRRLDFKDGDDATIGEMPHDDAGGARYEIHRDDLLDILFAGIVDRAEILFERKIAHLEQTPDGVSVTFNDGASGVYALVFGCDGSRSATRRLAFADAEAFSHFMGCYFFIKVVPATNLLPANVSQVFSVPGRTALLNGYDDRTDVALMFRSESEISFHHRNRAHQRRMVHDRFDGIGWKVPAVLAHLDEDDDFYFDDVKQIRMPTWSNGRIALVGDAGYCVSPCAGMGGSIALIGAARLGDALQLHRDDHVAAFRAYYDKLHPFVLEVQERAVDLALGIMLPADAAALAERNRMIGAGTGNP